MGNKPSTPVCVLWYIMRLSRQARIASKAIHWRPRCTPSHKDVRHAACTLQPRYSMHFATKVQCIALEAGKPQSLALFRRDLLQVVTPVLQSPHCKSCCRRITRCGAPWYQRPAARLGRGRTRAAHARSALRACAQPACTPQTLSPA